jgi:putative Holliday junction resolvase
MEISSVGGEALLDLSDRFKQRSAPAAVVLGSRENGTVHLVANFDDSVAARLSAGDVVKQIAPIVGGGGGGRPTMARAGGKEPDKLPEALERARELISAALGGRGGACRRRLQDGRALSVRPSASPTGNELRRAEDEAALAMKVLALDYGSARTGVAVSDPTGTIARPVATIARVAETTGFDELVALVRGEAPELVVVGLPLTLRGDHGEQAQETSDFVERLRAAIETRVELWDERFTSVLADGDDARAAAHLLSSYLEWQKA